VARVVKRNPTANRILRLRDDVVRCPQTEDAMVRCARCGRIHEETAHTGIRVFAVAVMLVGTLVFSVFAVFMAYLSFFLLPVTIPAMMGLIRGLQMLTEEPACLTCGASLA
jgi:hypothetical protein